MIHARVGPGNGAHARVPFGHALGTPTRELFP
jgi:hypothetical protein